MRIIRILFALFIIYGFFAFTGWGMAILDSIPFLSPIEWPLGTVSGVVRDSSGGYVASKNAYSRVQVYDQNLNFITDWSVDNGGGNFYLLMNTNDQVEVFCVRTGRGFVYNLDGTLASQSDYSYDNYPDLGADTMTVSFPTPIYLLPFTSPAYGWAVGVIGVIGLAAANWLQKEKRSAPSAVQ
jgi:hypothetical protein